MSTIGIATGFVIHENCCGVKGDLSFLGGPLTGDLGLRGPSLSRRGWNSSTHHVKFTGNLPDIMKKHSSIFTQVH